MEQKKDDIFKTFTEKYSIETTGEIEQDLNIIRNKKDT